MSVRALSAEWDWEYGKGRQSYKRGLEELKQNIATRIKSFRYDCFFSREEGIDYLNLIDGSRKKFLEYDIKRVIIQTIGVVSILSFSSILTKRNIRIEAKIKTIYGTTEIGGEMINA